MLGTIPTIAQIRAGTINVITGMETAMVWGTRLGKHCYCNPSQTGDRSAS